MHPPMMGSLGRLVGASLGKMVLSKIILILSKNEGFRHE
jgi:hypothetical protein